MTMNWARQTTMRSAFVERSGLELVAVVEFTRDTVRQSLSRYKRGVYPGSRADTQPVEERPARRVCEERDR
jgi:hypothetical protein